MSIVVPVKDGKIVDETASQTSLSESKKAGSLDKEAFLQLLVAQMKYQDPLEPTSNTEYISQLATFSSLEEMQNLNATMTTQQATNLVGKTVIMNVTSKSGANNVVQGKVDFVVKQNNKVYLSIDDNLYNIEDLDKVVDDEYLEALGIAGEFEEAMDKLPSEKQLRLSDKDDLERVRKAYNSLSTYQQEFIRKYSSKAFEKLQTLLARMKAMEEESKANGGGSTGETEGTDKTEGESTDKTGDTEGSSTGK